jgi:hypothetical protein
MSLLKKLVLMFVSVVLFSNSLAFGREGKADTIVSVSLENLYKQADFVSFVKILSGDVEHYNGAIYKAEVLKAYKGAKEKEIIYFGEFISYGIGSEYLAFFNKADKTIGQLIDEDVKNSSAPYNAKQSFFRIMYAGYSIMPVGFECLFDVKNKHNKCDYGIQLNVRQVKIPSALNAFLEETDTVAPDERWVRRTAIENTLEDLKRKNP